MEMDTKMKTKEKEIDKSFEKVELDEGDVERRSRDERSKGERSEGQPDAPPKPREDFFPSSPVIRR